MKLTYNLEIDLEDLPADKLAEFAETTGMSVEDFGSAEDVDAWELGEMIRAHLEHSDEEFWAGSDMFAQIKTARVRQTLASEKVLLERLIKRSLDRGAFDDDDAPGGLWAQCAAFANLDMETGNPL